MLSFYASAPTVFKSISNHIPICAYNPNLYVDHLRCMPHRTNVLPLSVSIIKLVEKYGPISNHSHKFSPTFHKLAIPTLQYP